MKIKRSNIAIRYYNFVYGKPPIDFCSLFWGLFFAIIFFFVAIPGGWLSKKTDYEIPAFACGMLPIFVIEIIAIIYKDWRIFLGFILFVIGVSLFVLIVSGIVYLIKEYFLSKKEVKKEVISEEPSRFSIWVGAIRQKHCIKIKYIS